MENFNVKENQIIRLYAFPPDSRNAKAKVRRVFSNGDVWLTNHTLSNGIINRVFSKEEFENLTSTK